MVVLCAHKLCLVFFTVYCLLFDLKETVNASLYRTLLLTLFNAILFVFVESYNIDVCDGFGMLLPIRPRIRRAKVDVAIRTSWCLAAFHALHVDTLWIWLLGDLIKFLQTLQFHKPLLLHCQDLWPPGSVLALSASLIFTLALTDFPVTVVGFDEEAGVAQASGVTSVGFDE